MEPNAATIAQTAVLRWAQNKAVGVFPSEAWQFESFERLSGGRNCSVVHLVGDHNIWSIRVEDPDKTVAGRIWTTEINISADEDALIPQFTLRLLVSTPESVLTIEPHVPGVVRQIIDAPGLWAGEYKLIDRPLTIKTERGKGVFFNALLDPSRKLPIIALSIPEGPSLPTQPLLDAKILAQACAGLAIVTVLSPDVSWALTERFGKRLSVHSGAARVYLPGFTEDSNPFGGHELLLPTSFASASAATLALTRLRWIAANGSVRRLHLGEDVIAFSAVKAEDLQRRQLALQGTGATDQEQLGTANARLELLETQLEQSRDYEQQFSDLHKDAEQRAEAAEAQLRASGFRIQQLLEQLTISGVTPDAEISLPGTWPEFANWCDVNLAGRVVLSPQARRSMKDAEFEDVTVAAKCLLWLANDYRNSKTGDGGSLRDANVASGVINAHCGSDSYEMEWQGRKHEIEWHIKNGGNTRDPIRCLRIYHFWDDSSQQVVVASMPAHRRTDAT